MFIGAKNSQIVTLINTLFNDNHSNVMVISGNKSSGKTHLLQGCTFAAMDKQLNAVYVDIKEELPKDFLAQLSENDWVLLCKMAIFCSSVKFSRVKLTAKDNLVFRSFNRVNSVGKLCALIMSLVCVCLIWLYKSNSSCCCALLASSILSMHTQSFSDNWARKSLGNSSETAIFQEKQKQK
jgi:hypothetical protein